MQRRRREFDLELLEREGGEEEPAELAGLERLEAATPQPAPTRQENAPAAQQRAGKPAVTKLLARDPHPSLRKAPPVRPPKPPLREGREIDAIFDSSPYVKELVGAKLGKGTLEKAMVIDEEPA